MVNQPFRRLPSITIPHLGYGETKKDVAEMPADNYITNTTAERKLSEVCKRALLLF